jgi:putative DNA primase/helicase
LKDDSEKKGDAGPDPAGMTEEQIRQAVEARAAAEAAALAEKGAGGGGNGRRELTLAFVKECLRCNELGDGLLYAGLHQGRYVYNTSSQKWLKWAGHHWEVDQLSEAVAAVEAVAEKYLELAAATNAAIAKETRMPTPDGDKVRRLKSRLDKCHRRALKLRGVRGRSCCIQFAHTGPHPLSIRGDELDLNPWVLPCANGVINLRTGELERGRPDQFLFKSAPTQWRGIDHPAPTWERFLVDVFDNDEPLIAYVWRLLGYCITGHTHENILPVFWGQGRNGKGTIIETIKHVLGDLANPIQVEMLLDQGRSRSSAGPSPDIMALKGARFTWASESDDNRRFSTSRVKWLTGSDTLVGRWPNDKYEVSFRPSHKLVLMTNNRPHAPSDDFAFWERIHLIPFRLSFVNRQPQADNERRADLGLGEKLQREAPGILAWLVRGCLEWQRIGLDPPTVVREATNEYRREEDLLQDWIDECCIIDPAAVTKAAKLYANFQTWYEENVSRKKSPSQRRFGQMLTKKFRREKRGTYLYYGIDCLEPDGQEKIGGWD